MPGLFEGFCNRRNQWHQVLQSVADRSHDNHTQGSTAESLLILPIGVDRHEGFKFVPDGSEQLPVAQSRMANFHHRGNLVACLPGKFACQASWQAFVQDDLHESGCVFLDGNLGGLEQLADLFIGHRGKILQELADGSTSQQVIEEVPDGDPRASEDG